MSASSEIRFKIGADTSALSRGLVQAQTVAAAAGKAIRKKLGMGDAFKSGVLALGLSIEKISEKLAEMFTGGAQESWKAALDAAKEAERIIEESALRRMSTLRQIEALEKEIARNAGKENANQQKTGEPGMMRKALGAIGENLFDGAAKLAEKLGANQNVVGSLRRSAGTYQQRGTNGDEVETPADAAKRSQEAIADRLAREAKIAELKEKSARDQARVDAAFLDVVRLSMTEEEKALQIQEEMIKAEEKLTEANRKGMETTELQLDVLRKQKALEEQLLKIEKEQTDEDKKKKRLREDLIEQYKRFLKAQGNVGAAKQGLADAKHDALAPDIQDLAGGVIGNGTDRVKAKQILELEKRARKLFASGRTITEFDPRTQRNVQVTGEVLMNRAAQLRHNFGLLKTEDQNPFKAAEEQLREANAHLKEIQDLLTPTDPE
jgi:hypothetical protein